MAYTADFQPFNLAQIYGAADQANNQKLQNQVLTMQMQKAQQAQADDEALKGAFNGAIGPDGTVDRKTLYANLYRVNPQKALEVQQAFSQQDLAAGKAKREDTAADITNRVQKSKYLRDTLANVTDQQSYENALNEAKTLGADFLTNSAPAQYDPNWVKGHVYDADKFITQNTPKIEMQDLGGKRQAVDLNPVTNPQLSNLTLDKTATPDALMTDSRTRAEGAANRAVTVRGQNMTDTRAKEMQGILSDGTPSPMIETTAQAIAAGKLAPMTGYALRSPGAQRIMARVMEINPDYSAINYGVQSKAEKDFATGKLGNTVRSFNVSLAHLQTLDELSDALANGNTQLINKIGNAYAAQTGNPAPTNFNAAKKIVADEIVKAIVGTGGGVADREEASRSIQDANSPQQLKGVINTYKDLMRGQINGLRDQYKATTGKDDFDTKYISEAGRKVEHGGDLSNPLSVTAPDGKVYTFKSIAQANEFKRQANIK